MILYLLDTAPGQNNSSQTIIQNSDLVVINLSQNPNTIEYFLKITVSIKKKHYF